MSGAVVDGRLVYVSPSAVTTFDPTQEGGCERRWFMKYKLGWPEPPRKAQKLGSETHGGIEHFAKTGEDVLNHVARAGVDLVRGYRGFVEAKRALVENEIDGVLVAAGVPVRGRIDILNLSGYHYALRDEAGRRVAVAELESPGTVEVLDWKTTKRIDEDEEGPGYAKQGEDLISTVQMATYAAWALEKVRDVRQVRLSHVYFQTYKARACEKRTALVPVERVRQRWREVEGVVGRMLRVVQESDPQRVTPNWASCDAFGGCPYRAACPQTSSQLTRGFLARFTESAEDAQGESAEMSNGSDFLSQLMNSGGGAPAPAPAPAPAAPPAPPQGQQAHVYLTGQAAQQYAAQQGSVPLPAGAGISAPPSALPPGAYLSPGSNVQPPVYAPAPGPPQAPSAPPAPQTVAYGAMGPMVYNGPAPAPQAPQQPQGPDPATLARLQAEDAAARAAAANVPPKPEEIVLAGMQAKQFAQAARLQGYNPGDTIRTTKQAAQLAGVLPPDAPAPGVTGPVADPIPPEQLATMPPAVQQAHAAIFPPTTMTATAPPAAGSMVVSMGPGATLSIAPQPTTTPTQSGYADTQIGQPPQAPAAPAEKPKRTRKPRAATGTATATQSTAPAEDTGGELWLFVDPRQVRGVVTTPLEDYATMLREEMEKAGQVLDVRLAPEGHVYAYGKWKGILAAQVRKAPPGPGCWTIHGVAGDEFKAALVAALEPLCAMLVRS